jgi:hypothetical protein
MKVIPLKLDILTNYPQCNDPFWNNFNDPLNAFSCLYGMLNNKLEEKDFFYEGEKDLYKYINQLFKELRK